MGDVVPMDRPLPRVPPHDIAAEVAVLGAVMVDARSLDTLEGSLTAEDFYRQAHGRIFEAQRALHARRDPVDEITLSAELGRRGHLELVGGATLIRELAGAVPSAWNVEAYARTVIGHAATRRLIRVSSEIAIRGYDAEGDPSDLLEEAERAFLAVTRVRRDADPLPIRAVMDASLAVSERARRGEDVGVMTGVPSLDRMTRGLQPADLILIAARPSIGKSALAGNIALHAALNDVPTLVFSLEMGGASIGIRLLAARSTLPASSIRGGNLDLDELEMRDRAANEIGDLPLWIDPTPGISPGALASKVRRYHRAHNVRLVVVDYIGLMRVPGKSERREREVAECSAALKGLAMELSIPVVALSQLRRPIPGAGKERKPGLADLRDSGALEQDADVVMLLHRANVTATEAELEIAKHRNGPTGSIKLGWNPLYQRFAELAETGPRNWSDGGDRDAY